MVLRLFFTLFLFLSVLYFPFYLTAALALFGIIFFSFYLEGLCLLALSDLLFGSLAYATFPYWSVVAGGMVLLGAEALKTKFSLHKLI